MGVFKEAVIKFNTHQNVTIRYFRIGRGSQYDVGSAKKR